MLCCLIKVNLAVEPYRKAIQNAMVTPINEKTPADSRGNLKPTQIKII